MKTWMKEKPCKSQLYKIDFKRSHMQIAKFISHLPVWNIDVAELSQIRFNDIGPVNTNDLAYISCELIIDDLITKCSV